MVHEAIIMSAQQEYRKRQVRAVLHPDSYCSIIIDNANQSSFRVPHFVTRSEDMKRSAIKVKLIGVLEHIKQSRLQLFSMTNNTKLAPIILW